MGGATSTSWIKGQSGNLEGRPKGALGKFSKREETVFFREGAREHNGDCLEFWASVMCDVEVYLGYRLKASQFLSEAGNGKAPIALSVDLDDKTKKEPPIVIEHWYTKEELAKRAKEYGLG